MNQTRREVLITGGTAGIGWACAQYFAREGNHVIVTTRHSNKAQQINDEINYSGQGYIRAVVSSLADETALEHLLAQTGVPDVLVNNAGLNIPVSFLDVDMADFDAMFAINVRSVFALTQMTIRMMLDQGRPGAIVNIASQAGLTGLPERSVYCAAKHALEGMIKAIAVDLKGHDIRINNVAPTFIDTEMTRSTLARPDFQSLIQHKLLLTNLPELEDVAAAVFFLASSTAAGITGATLKVDGGWTAH